MYVLPGFVVKTIRPKGQDTRALHLHAKWLVGMSSTGSLNPLKYLKKRWQDSSKEPEGLSVVPTGDTLETWAVALCSG